MPLRLDSESQDFEGQFRALLATRRSAALAAATGLGSGAASPVLEIDLQVGPEIPESRELIGPTA